MSDPRKLQRPAADYIAGDLDPAEAAAFEQTLAADPDLGEELAFWERMGPALRSHGRPAGAHLPGPGLIAVARRRAREEEEAAAARPQRLGPAAYAGWVVAAAALILLTISLLDRPAPPPAPGVTIAYAEDGSAQVLPSSVAGLLPVAHRPQHESLAVDGTVARHQRPWLGIWTQPIDLKGFERSRGLRVVRIAADGPAARAGIAPGDILLDFADCPMATRYCISHAIQQGRLKPGDTAQITFWQASSGNQLSVPLTLGCCLE